VIKYKVYTAQDITMSISLLFSLMSHFFAILKSKIDCMCKTLYQMFVDIFSIA